MNWNNWKYKLAAWMQGRYGIDPMYKGLVIAYAAVLILNLFVRSSLLWALGTALLLFAMYRVFSKQLSRRAEENRRYLAFVDSVKKKTLLAYNRVKSYKTHRYRECPNCHTTLRLKKQIGTITVNCPKCRNTFQVTIRR